MACDWPTDGLETLLTRGRLPLNTGHRRFDNSIYGYVRRQKCTSNRVTSIGQFCGNLNGRVKKDYEDVFRRAEKTDFGLFWRWFP